MGSRCGEGETRGDRPGREREETISSLALRYRSGDRSALGELYAALEPLIRSFVGPCLSARRPLPVGMEAEDLYQQSYILLAEAALEWQCDRHDNFMPYFIRSFPWRLDRYLRSQTPSRRAVRVQLHSVPHDALVERVAGMAGPDGRDWDDELLCSGLLEGLPRSYRRVVRLHLYDGLPFAQVAREVGMSRSAAHEAFGRAVSMLRSALQEPSAPSRDAAALRASPRQRDGVDAASLRRCVEAMHILAPGGAPLPGREALCRAADLTWREYREIMAKLRASGCLVGRRRGSAGSLTCATPSETMRRMGADWSPWTSP